MSLKKELGLNELIILCNITFYVNTFFTYNLSLSKFTFRYDSDMFTIQRKKGWSYYNRKPQRLKKQINTLLSNDELFEGYTS